MRKNSIKSSNFRKETEKKEPKNFYLQVYDNVIDANDPLNDLLVRDREHAGQGETDSCSRVGVGEAVRISTSDDGTPDEDACLTVAQRQLRLEERRKEIKKRHLQLLRKIQQYEEDIELQENKRQAECEAIAKAGDFLKDDEDSSEKREKPSEGTDEEKRRFSDTEERKKSFQEMRELRVRELKEKSLATKEETLKSRETVAAFSRYKDHVIKAVEMYPSEASGSVEQLIARFRDVLTLRCELLAKVQDAFNQLHATKLMLQETEQKEQEKEGSALLQLYSSRALSQSSKHRLQQVEDKIGALQNTSCRYSTLLAQLQVAVSNMYSIARLYQRSLPPVPQEHFVPSPGATKLRGASTSGLLDLLHNFLHDANTVIKMASEEEMFDSTRNVVGSECKTKI